MSDARNRDDSLERLLRKAKPMLGGTGTPEACLDAETVAAWAAGGLSRDEFERAQEHTAGCTRCQALVALMVRIDPATAVDEVPAPRSRAWIGWVVPLAAAAGLVLFLMTRPPGSQAPSLTAVPPAPASGSLGSGQQEIAVPSTLAQAASPANVPVQPPAVGSPAPSTVGGVNAAPVDAMPPAEPAQLRQNRLADAGAAAKPGGGATAGQGAGTDLARAAEKRTMPVGQGQTGSVGAIFRSASGGMTAPPPAGATATPSPPPATPAPVTPLGESVRMAAPPTNASAPPPAPPPPAPPPAATPPPQQAQQAQQAQTATFIGAGRGGAGGRGGGAAGGGGGGRAAGVAGGAVGGGASPVLDGVASVAPRVVVVSSPNSAVRWRATGALVERSTDSGATWQFVARVVDADLRAASSPSPLVCWLVGRDGKVVVFTEGRTAREVTFPEMIDLTTVRATDDQIATVTAANGREYSTINGGLSWNSR